MDELLSLFGGAVDGDDQSSHAAPPDQGDHCHESSKTKTTAGAPTSISTAVSVDFRSAFRAFSADILNTRGEQENHRNSNNNRNQRVTTKNNANATNHYNTPCADPITGLRIVDRRTSRADMVDAFSSFTYRTCSILAASSRVEWSREYLVDLQSQPNNDMSIGGKTNLATCGILTCETSSRLSSKTGRAFATLTLGDLPSSSFSNSSPLTNEIHASITVFLFGDALSVLRVDTKQYIRPGWAVAILGPNLMPPRSDNAGKNGGSGTTTSVTLSVNDPRQILPIGRAVDCDRCKGTIRKRVASDGAPPRWEDVRCCTLVDTRHSAGRGYCQMHRKQGLSSASSGGTNKPINKGSNLTFVQRHRNEHKTINISSTQERGSTLDNAGNIRLGMGGASLSGLLNDQTLPDQKKCNMKRVPLHMKKLPNVNKVVDAATNNKEAKIVNPYSASTMRTINKGSIPTADPKKKHSLHDILGEALDGKRSRSTISNDKRPQSKVFNTNGYDGSVQVPKPNSVLFQNSGQTSSCSMRATTSISFDRPFSSSILDKQRSLAELLKKSGGATDSSKAINARNIIIDKQSLTRSKQKILSTERGLVTLASVPSGVISQHTNDFASAFSSSNTSTSEQLLSDAETILNAKSRFASVADAEEYARARSVVQALEAKEGAKECMNSRKKDVKSPCMGSIVTTGWACHTCNKRTPFKPVSCVHLRHDVRQCRELKGGSSKSLGSQKNRLSMHGKDEESGGLTLGSGLEWSGWRGGFG